LSNTNLSKSREERGRRICSGRNIVSTEQYTPYEVVAGMFFAYTVNGKFTIGN
jgi:hypothetical protein